MAQRKCQETIRLKHVAEGTEKFAEESQKCAATLSEGKQEYVVKLKEKFAGLPKCSKKWWSLCRELLHRKAKLSTVPALKDGANWLSDAKAKADLFVRTFASKSTLPEEIVDTPFFGPPANEFDSFISFRSRVCRRLLKTLNGNKATGHDHISAEILKRFCDCLAIPFTLVCRRLFKDGCWPAVWKYHMVVPIFKKGPAFAAGNYRGVHLTPILSKIAEKMIGYHLVPFLQKYAFGDNQWAFSKGLRSRDLVTILMLTWILTICLDKKIGAYLSDISGAFDRVFKPYLLAKLHRAGVGDEFLAFLSSYLSPRRGQIVVQGTHSDHFEIADSFYQGTMMGPPLWNIFVRTSMRQQNPPAGVEEIRRRPQRLPEIRP